MARNKGFIWKASRPRRLQTTSLKNHLPQVIIQAYCILKRGSVAGGCKLLDVRILYCQVTDVLVNLQMLFSFVSINNTNVIFYSVTCSLYINGKVLYPLRVRALRMGLSCIFQTIGNILNLKQKPQNTKVKDTGLMWSQICSSFYTVTPGTSASFSPTSPGWSDSRALGSQMPRRHRQVLKAGS